MKYLIQFLSIMPTGGGGAVITVTE